MIRIEEFGGVEATFKLNEFLKKNERDIDIQEIKYRPVLNESGEIEPRYCLVYEDEPFEIIDILAELRGEDNDDN